MVDQLVDVGGVLAEVNFARLGDLDNRQILGVAGGSLGLRHVDVDPILYDVRREHKDDEKHQNDVNKWSYVNFGDCQDTPSGTPAATVRTEAEGHSSLSEASFGQVDELEREVVHSRAEFLQHMSEVVIEDRRRDGRKQSHARWRTSASEIPGPTDARLVPPDVPSISKALMIPRTVPKSPMNGDTDGSRREPVEVVFEAGQFLVSPELQTTFESGFVAEPAAGLHLPVDLGIAEIEDRDQG